MAGSKHIFVSKLHKWVGLLVAVQMLFWTVGGVVMSWIPIEIVRGETNRSPHVSEPVSAITMQNILSAFPTESIVSMRVRNLAGMNVVELHFEDREMALISVKSFEEVEITENLALEIAEADFKGGLVVPSVTLLTEEPGDYRRSLPVWQVEMGDSDNTRIYVDTHSGRVISRRNDYWRVYDFFWMLHIMDYDERDDFNNPLLMIFAFTAALFSVTGMFMIYYRFHRRDFGFKKKKRV